jgi:FixJ family two-component response regulator
MQRIRTVMTAQPNPAAFASAARTAFQIHYPHNSADGNGPKVLPQIISRTATQTSHRSLPFDGVRPSCETNSLAVANTRFDESIVHIVRNDPTGTKSLTDFFFLKGVSFVTFRSSAEYMAAPRDDRPTCLILDLDLPDLHGLDMQTMLVGKGAPPVIFVTSHGDPVSVVQAMKNGAIDFMLEPVDYVRLMTAVELAFSEDLKNRKARIELASLLARWWSLTEREAEVFHYTVAGLLNKQAAAELGVAENTYQVHRGRVMRKMQANSLADLVRMSTKLEPILPKPCRTRLCYGTAVVVPMRTEEYGPHSRSNAMTRRENIKGVTLRA